MSRHRKVKNLNFEDEYDDYYGAYDDDDEDYDLGDGNFEAKYLSSGIDLNLSESSSNSKARQQQLLSPPLAAPVTSQKDMNAILQGFSDNAQSESRVVAPQFEVASSTSNEGENYLVHKAQQSTPVISQDGTPAPPPIRVDSSPGDSSISMQIPVADGGQTDSQCTRDDSFASNLTIMAIKHLDRHQWQLPLLEMDQKFRDRTYYKHYTDRYISSLRSKLGHFLADNRLISNPMRHHTQRELDNYERHSKMFELLTEYYQSLGSSFFSFATPSPDEEIVIGCRLGTKGFYRPQAVAAATTITWLTEISMRLLASWRYLCCCLSHHQTDT